MLAPTPEAQRQLIAERALLQRRRQRIPQRKLAAQLGWGPNRISGVETSQVSLDVFELYRLAEALDCQVEYLLGLAETPGAGPNRTGGADTLG